MRILLTFDVGTTSMKCCAFNEDFSMLASTTVEYALNTRGEHIVEADPGIYWDGMCKSIRTLQEKELLDALAAVPALETVSLLAHDGETRF